MIVNIAEAKANLSRLINLARSGEKVIIARHNMPLVELVVHRPEGKRQLGLLKGEIEVPDDLSAGDEEVEAMFYGEDA